MPSPARRGTRRDSLRGTLRGLAWRVVQALLVVWAASTIAFLLVRLAPGDPWSARFLGNPDVPPTMRAEWAAARGLDAPLPVQYGRWLALLARGELGWSASRHRPVADVLREALPRTLLLMGLALASSLALGIAVGRWQGVRADGPADQATSLVTLLGVALPEYWIAILLLQGATLGIGLDAGRLLGASLDVPAPWTWASVRATGTHLLLPWLTLTITGTAIFSRFQRASMAAAYAEPFVQTARAKGLDEPGVRHHAWRNALPPVVTTAGLTLPVLVGGAVFVERVFRWPGIGDTAVAAVQQRDYDLVLAVVVLGAALTVAGSMLADAVLERVDPRARTSR
jgi:peptide/nickel transport system permease protein